LPDIGRHTRDVRGKRGILAVFGEKGRVTKASDK